MSESDRIYLENDHVVTVEGLKDQDGNVITGATVEARILDGNKRPVSGITWPLTLTDQGSGKYTGTLDKAVDLSLNAYHYLEVTAVSGSADARWRKRLIAVERD